MKIVSPCQLLQFFDFMFYVNAKTFLLMKIGGVEMVKDEISVTMVNKITKVLLTSVFSTWVKEDDSSFLLLFIPDEGLGNPQSWLKHM